MAFVASFVSNRRTALFSAGFEHRCQKPRPRFIRPLITCHVPLRVGPVDEGVIVRSFEEQACKVRLMAALEQDLRGQWASPLSLNFDLFSAGIRFTDPMSRLEGKAQYRGMLWSIGLLLRLLFRPGTAQFRLESCSLEPGDAECPEGRILTRFHSTARTRWGRHSMVICGTDRFWLSREPCSEYGLRISYHESIWDQTATEVRNEFFRRG